MIWAGPGKVCWAFLCVSSQAPSQMSPRMLPCLLAKVAHTVPGTWMWGREGLGRVPPCLHTGVSPRKDAVCEIRLPTCPGISSGINQSDSTQVLAVMAAEGWGSWAPDVVAGGVGRERLPPLWNHGGPWYTEGVREMFGAWNRVQICSKSQRLPLIKCPPVVCILPTQACLKLGLE